MCLILPKHLQNIAEKVYICNTKQKIPNAECKHAYKPQNGIHRDITLERL